MMAYSKSTTISTQKIHGKLVEFQSLESSQLFQ